LELQQFVRDRDAAINTSQIASDASTAAQRQLDDLNMRMTAKENEMTGIKAEIQSAERRKMHADEARTFRKEEQDDKLQQFDLRFDYEVNQHREHIKQQELDSADRELVERVERQQEVAAAFKSFITHMQSQGSDGKDKADEILSAMESPTAEEIREALESSKDYPLLEIHPEPYKELVNAEQQAVFKELGDPTVGSLLIFRSSDGRITVATFTHVGLRVYTDGD
jgi:hypothetical protein